MFLADWQIADYDKIILPFVAQQVREVDGRKVISYGLSSYGYDIRLSARDFRIFRHIPGSIVDPKDFRQEFLTQCPAIHQEDGGIYFIIPARTYGLGVSCERFDLPPDVTGICLGKSTYARCGIIVNITPLEAGWQGYLTIEISNSSDADVKVYANEGIAQLLFSKGKPCNTTYKDRNGKYQSQKQNVTLARL